MGEVDQSQLRLRKKDHISGFSKNEKVEQPKSPDISLTQQKKLRKRKP